MLPSVYVQSLDFHTPSCLPTLTLASHPQRHLYVTNDMSGSQFKARPPPARLFTGVDFHVCIPEMVCICPSAAFVSQ